MTDRPPDRLPLWAYLVINALVWVFAALAWWATRQGWFMAPPANVPRPGAGAVLVFVPVAFALASVFDYLVSRREAARGDAPVAVAGRRAESAESDRDA